jgi:hypothetical protein
VAVHGLLPGKTFDLFKFSVLRELPFLVFMVNSCVDNHALILAFLALIREGQEMVPAKLTVDLTTFNEARSDSSFIRQPD